MPLMAGSLDDIKQWQKGIRSIRAEFRQEKITELLNRPIKSSGMIYLKTDIGLRWEYKDQMVVVYDGNDLYLYNIQLGEAEKIRGASGFVGPLNFDAERISKDYDVESKKDKGSVHLSLYPKKKMPFERMEMSFRNGTPLPYEVRVFEENGDRTVIMFENISINAPVSDELLRFVPPKGVKLKERAVN